MKDVDVFIDEKVYLFQTSYLKKMLKSKHYFFDYLYKNKTSTDFEKALNDVWKDLDFDFMNRSIEDLEKIVSQLNRNDLTIENIELSNLNQLVDENVFKTLVDKFMQDLISEYENKKETLSMGVDKEAYLSNYMTSYDKAQQTIPYFNKNGTIHSFHTIDSYCSMLFNTNLTRSAWNRTIYDAEVLEKDLVYLPAHTFACPKCMQYQGKIYSISGRSEKYPSQQVAINGGVGHPNCKHSFVIYWEGITDIREDKYNSEEWQEKYKTKQKIRALDRNIAKANNDAEIYEELNDTNRFQKEKKKLKAYRAKRRQLKETL